MPANLTADYLAAEQSFKHARTHEEKIAALEEMLATLPRHKGTEKMQAELRRRLSDARKESRKPGGHHGAPAYFIRREGAAQVTLIGPPNSGKSSLLAALTHAHPEIAAYPFTTRLPLPGMMPFEDVRIQLVDTPAMSPEYMESWMAQVVRAADMSILVLDPNDPEVLGGAEFILRTLEEWRAPAPKLAAGNKLDQEGAAENFAAVESLYGDRFRYLAVSAASGRGLCEFARETYRGLDLVRFYSKAPGKKPDLAVPYVLPRGATVQEAAAHVHRDFAEHLKYARLFHKDREHDGRMVERAHAVEDQDVLEFHAEG
ncbi:MAG: 50S ribosome-binding GTPase [Acidobacteria bacterium]|nr:50S ribosome-binding GTPase [Acidobacteriota bacterium]